MNRKHHTAVYLNTIFLLLIFGFALANLLRPQAERSETENRSLQLLPQLTWQKLISGEFSKKYEDYLSDQFVLRDKWITLKTGAERALLKQETGDVYFGKDGYLIEKHTGSFTSDTADANIYRLQTFVETAAQNIGEEHVTVMLIPNAVDILKDKLPPYADPCDEEAYLAKLSGALADRAGVFFDASGVLRSFYESAERTAEGLTGPDGDPALIDHLYYRTDHHWTTGASYLVFSKWAKERGFLQETPAFTMKEVSDTFEGTVAARLGITPQPDTIERCDPENPFDYYLVYNRSDDIRNTAYQESFLDTRNQYAYFFGGNYGLIEAKMPDNATGRRLLIVKDSYAHCFAPFTFACFDEVDMLDPRYYNESIQELLSQKDYTDILCLFNAAGFAEETALARLLL